MGFADCKKGESESRILNDGVCKVIPHPKENGGKFLLMFQERNQF
jgi:hypothetical protein